MDPLSTFQAVIDRDLAAYEAEDAEGCAALYAEDGELVSPFGPPVRGRVAIAAAHRDWFSEGETNKTMTVVRAGIDGALGYCLVRYAAEVPVAAGGRSQSRGLSLNVMERRSDGHWTIKLTSLNEQMEQVMESHK